MKAPTRNLHDIFKAGGNCGLTMVVIAPDNYLAVLPQRQGVITPTRNLHDIFKAGGDCGLTIIVIAPGNYRATGSFDDSLKRAGNLVGKHVRKVVGQLKTIDEGLWRHLSNKAVLKSGQTCHYDAEGGHKWQKR